MAADSPSGCLVDRLNTALDRLEIALETCETRLKRAAEASALFHAMADDRSAMADRIDVAQTRASALEAAAVGADPGIAAAAREVRNVLLGVAGRG
jgi:hypothetical protein